MALPLRDEATAIAGTSGVAPRRPARAHTEERVEGRHARPRARTVRPVGAPLLRDTATVVQHGQVFWSAQQSLTAPGLRRAEASRPVALHTACRKRRPARAGVRVGWTQRRGT